mmetsp:Transcript_83474/g.232878  ORF Transcript_83474/g.232878 Transcript_83474/m.232878 type:complete len:316 (-) Transcript_83474:246-1193(-)
MPGALPGALASSGSLYPAWRQRHSTLFRVRSRMVSRKSSVVPPTGGLLALASTGGAGASLHAAALASPLPACDCWMHLMACRIASESFTALRLCWRVIRPWMRRCRLSISLEIAEFESPKNFATCSSATSIHSQQGLQYQKPSTTSMAPREVALAHSAQQRTPSSSDADGGDLRRLDRCGAPSASMANRAAFAAVSVLGRSALGPCPGRVALDGCCSRGDPGSFFPRVGGDGDVATTWFSPASRLGCALGVGSALGLALVGERQRLEQFGECGGLLATLLLELHSLRSVAALQTSLTQPTRPSIELGLDEWLRKG